MLSSASLAFCDLPLGHGTVSLATNIYGAHIMHADLLWSMKFSFVKAMIHQLMQNSGTKIPMRGNTLEQSVDFFFFHTSYNDAKTTSFPGVRTLKIAFMALQSHLRTLWHNLLLLLGHSSGHIFPSLSRTGTEIWSLGHWPQYHSLCLWTLPDIFHST